MKYYTIPLNLLAFVVILTLMNRKTKVIFNVLLLILALLIHVFSLNKQWVEKYYAQLFYPKITSFLRAITAYLPFSLGDILYGGVIVWMIYKLWRLFVLIYRKQFSRQLFKSTIISVGFKLLWVYIIFNIFWGLNYNRVGIAQQIGIVVKPYSNQDLLSLNQLLLDSVNQKKLNWISEGRQSLNNKALFTSAKEAYIVAQKSYPFLQYPHPSVKSSVWGWVGNYTGFMGYYNPFSGEAQLNISIPRFLLPYTICHEIGHQMGYAKENEANFVGFLAASASSRSDFQYSVYLDLFLYANRNLYRIDSITARSMSKQLHPEIKADLIAWQKFNDKHKNPFEPVIRWAYGKYLQNNQQPSGMMSYDEVTAFMIAYYKHSAKLK